MNEPQTRIETKTVKYTFNDKDLLVIGADLSRALTTVRLLGEEFDEVKASYKAKATQADANVGRLSSQIECGFDVRPTRVWAVYRPTDRKKHYYLEGKEADGSPVLTEDMLPGDYQTDLIQAESKFEVREEIQLFQPAGQASGIMVVGRQNERWFSALRISINQSQRIEERLDAEQKSVKKRFDAVTVAADRAKAWLSSALGKEVAKGFDGPIDAAIEAHKEREE